VRSVLVVWLIFLAMVVFSANARGVQAVDLPDWDDNSMFDTAPTDEVEPPTGTVPPTPDPHRHGVQAEAPLRAGRTPVHDVFRPPTRDTTLFRGR
jgi:hypothetical protein